MVFNLVKEREPRNPLCYFGWGGLLILIFGAFSLGYGYSRRGNDFRTHRRGLIIAGGLAVGIFCVGIITCVVVSVRRKRAPARDEEDLLRPAPTTRQPNLEPPMNATQNGTHLQRGVGTDPRQGANHHGDAQQNDVDSLPNKPPPAYSEYPSDRVCRDPNPSSLLNV
jgi:hypothetical protein